VGAAASAGHPVTCQWCGSESRVIDTRKPGGNLPVWVAERIEAAGVSDYRYRRHRCMGCRRVWVTAEVRLEGLRVAG